MNPEVETAPATAPAPRAQQALWGLTALLCAWGLLRAAQLQWVCDDAFISFRYADHLAQGHGLVFNPGERVEGMTNLLWTLALALGSALGADVVSLSQVLGWFSYAAVLALVLALGWNLRRPDALHVPMATWVLALMPEMQRWATGGLETMTAAALAALMALLLLRDGAGKRTELWAGWVGGMLFLVRPDGALIVAALALGYALMARATPRVALGRLLRVGIPFALVVAAVSAFRVSYYGDLLPNTFYAKSTHVAYWKQGLVYLGLLLARAYVLVLLALFALLAWRAARGRTGPVGALLGATALFSAYVVYSGGDFMFARRFIPVLPLLLVALAVPLGWSARGRAWVAAVVVLALGAALPLPLYEKFGRGGRILNVADEPAFYPPELIQLRRRQGEALARAFEGLPAAFVIEGGLCVLAYYSRWPAIIEINGLTDRTIARQSVASRAMPGHEKHPTDEYLDARRVQFLVLHAAPAARGSHDLVRLQDVGLFLRARYYDPAVMEPLSTRPQVRALPAAKLLELAQQRVERAGCSEARGLLASLDGYLFQHDSRRAEERARLAAQVAARCAPGRPSK